MKTSSGAFLDSLILSKGKFPDCVSVYIFVLY